MTVAETAGVVTVLNLGCGRKTDPGAYGVRVRSHDGEEREPESIVFFNLDQDATVRPDLRCTLGEDRIPLEDDTVDLALAYHVLEHIGHQGDLREWFQFWADLYRVMKPTGRLQFQCPYHSSVWAWADPTHARAISEFTFLYLNQDAYRSGGAIPDYRPPFDWRLETWMLREDATNETVRRREGATTFIEGSLRPMKPLRPYWEDA